MALTEITQPFHLNLSKNQIPYVLETDKYVSAAGAATDFQISIEDIPVAEDKTMEFLFPDGTTVIMVTKSTPDDSGVQFPETISGAIILGAELSQYAIQILPYFKQNHTLRSKYTMTCGPLGLGNPGYINFVAKEETAETNILFDTNYADFTWGGIDVTGVAPLLNENFFIGCDVFVENVKNSGTYINAGTLFGAPDDNDQVAFDLSKILDPYLSNDFFPIPDVNAVICENNCKRFYIEYYEFYGSVPVEKAVTQSDTFLVLKGALHHVDFYRPALDFYTHYVDEIQFLTWKKTRRVNQTQKEFLYWFNNYERVDVGGDPDIIFLRVKAYYTDGTTDEGITIGDPDSVQDDVVMFAAGYTELDYFAVFNPAKTVYKYEAWLQSDVAEDILTEKITFWISEADYLDKIFYYENNLGGMETLRTTGIHDFSNEVTSEEARRNLPTGVTKATTLRQIFPINTTNRNVNIGRTGDVVENKIEAQALREFFTSEETYAINPKGIIYAIIVTPESRPESIDDYNLFGYEFEYTEAFINKGYSAYNV